LKLWLGVWFLAEAIEADRAAAAAAEARRDVVARAAIVATAFDQVSRAIRRTVMLAERLDRGWARPVHTDDRAAMARRQVARAVHDAIARHPDATRETERLDSLDRPDEIGDRPTEEIIRAICRDLGLDPVRMSSAGRMQPSGVAGEDAAVPCPPAARPLAKRGLWPPPPRAPP
jgi:hypothetical protein